MNRTDYYSKFSCPVCLRPSQNMVFGLCQHFVCASCLYELDSESLKPVFYCCPLCKAKDVFPDYRPENTTKLLMNIVGVVECPRKRCGEEMWAWDVEEHQRSCVGIGRRSSARCSRSTASGRSGQRVATRQSERQRSKSPVELREVNVALHLPCFKIPYRFLCRNIPG
nr:TNF receptor-associated factor 6-like [Rhipicephalus microplus]